MSSHDFPSAEGVEMVLQAGVARLGPPVKACTRDIPWSHRAQQGHTAQCNAVISVCALSGDHISISIARCTRKPDVDDP